MRFAVSRARQQVTFTDQPPAAATSAFARRRGLPRSRAWRTIETLDLGYTVQIYRDGHKAHWSTAPRDIPLEERRVTNGDMIELRMAPGGGQAIIFVAR